MMIGLMYLSYQWAVLKYKDFNRADESRIHGHNKADWGANLVLKTCIYRWGQDHGLGLLENQPH
jgi:hypothetical protein